MDHFCETSTGLRYSISTKAIISAAMIMLRRGSAMSSKALRVAILQSLPMSTTTASTCPITGTTSSKSIPSSPIDDRNPRPFSEIPGPVIYPLLGSIIDFTNTGGNMSASNTVYYYKYGAITKQNITGNEIIIFDPREHLKGELQVQFLQPHP